MPGSFRYPYRWPDLAPGVIGVASPPAKAVDDFTTLQEDRDRALEDYLENLKAGTGGLRFATRVVAASDSLDTAAAHADYVCTGTADETIINQALADVVAGPRHVGRVLLMEGVYHVTGPLSVPFGCTVQGQGKGTSIFATGAFKAFDIGGAGTTVADLQLIAIGSGITGWSAATGNQAASFVQRCLFSGCSLACDATRGCVIEDNFITGGAIGGSIGVRCHDKNVFVRHNQITTATIEVGTTGTAGFNQIVGNYFDDVGGISGPGITLGAGAVDSEVHDNLFIQLGTTTHPAILLTGGAGCLRNSVQANVIRGWSIADTIRLDANVTDNLVVLNDLKNGTLTDNGTGTVLNLDGSANRWNRL